ncbi:uncharacterized protein L199_008021 [Kwoniella botswanensis]|uniref:uncharacterized protein n=1 Tax=Kwoniella botswanensis TaxID=1268659 RepID=UPI00315C5E70
MTRIRTIPKSHNYDEEAETLLVPRLRLLGLSNDQDQYDHESEGHDDLPRIVQPSSVRHRFTTRDFSYKTYPQSGSPVKLVYVESKSEADSQLSRLAGSIIGLDMEYVGPTWTRNQRPVLLQFSDERLIVLVHLRDIDHDILHGGPQIGLATLCEKYLGLESCRWHEGNYSGILTERQKDYAANDAYASLQMCLKLQHLAEEKRIYLDLVESCTELSNRDIPSTVPVQRPTDNHAIDDLTSSSPVQGQI